MTLGAGKPAQECESGKSVTEDLSLRATGGFSRTGTRDPCAPQWALQSSGWGKAELVFQGPGQVDWRNKILFLGLLVSQKSGSLLSWLAFYCPDKSQSVHFQSRTWGTKQCPPQRSPCWELGSAGDSDWKSSRWVGLTLPNQCYKTGSCLSGLTLLLPLFLGFFPEVSFSCRTSLENKMLRST